MATSCMMNKIYLTKMKVALHKVLIIGEHISQKLCWHINPYHL